MAFRAGKHGKTKRSLGERAAGGAEAFLQSGHLHLRARTLADGLHGGRHRTAHRGGSTEFYDYRAYAAGDPISLIDWKVFARTDRDYVRRFQHESQLTVMLVVDASASMDFTSLDGRGALTKLGRAKELAAALAYLAIRQGDRCGLVIPRVIGSSIAIPPATGMAHLHQIMHELEQTPAVGDGGLAMGLEEAGALVRDSGLVIALGDGLEEADPIRQAAAQLRFGRGGRTSMLGGGQNRGSEVAFLQVLSPDEIDLASVGSVRMVDPETRQAVVTDTAAIAEGYHAIFKDHQESLRHAFESVGGRCVLSRLDATPEDALRAFLYAR